jgi:hypothetical protein
MTREELYEIWAPSDTLWAPWAKAVIFARFRLVDFAPVPVSLLNISWLDRSQRMAIVVDLPGSSGVEMAMHLARNGFRPIPLYNAASAGEAVDELVDVRSILHALVSAADELRSIQLPFDAPPAFLLDANRRGVAGHARAQAGQFDNRSICFPTDFPSAAFLTQQGIKTVLLVSETDRNPQADLSHVLLRWQEAGLNILSIALADTQPPQMIHVQPPSRFRSFWYGWLAAFGLKRNTLGGFGGSVPFPGEGRWGMAG